jgi:gliding motility-associated-like protein
MIALVLSATLAKSQIVGANAFMKGTYVEVGVNTCGAYGTPTLPPAGYHPTEFGLGFVADPDMDGWATGTPDYCGDYFVPGSPVEGWQVQVGLNVYTNTDQSCWFSEVPGSIASYDFTAGVYTVVWSGNTPLYDLDVIQTTTLGIDDLFFVTRVLLCNNEADTLYNVYYNRNVDPDQDQPWSGSFVTYNEIVYQPPTDPDALVTSEGLTYGCFLGMGAKDPNARVSYGNFSTTDGTPKNVWDGTAGYSSSGSNTQDEATSIAFYIDKIPPGECKCLAFAYVLDTSDLDDALDATLTAVNVTADSIDITASETAYICPGDSTQLVILNGEDYTWSWSPGYGLDSYDNDTVWAFPDTTTVYDIVGNGTCGDVFKTLTVVVNPPAVADAGPDIYICPGDTLPMAGSGGVSYLWTPPVYLSDPTSPTSLLENPLTDMFYMLEVIDANGCKDVDDMQVFLNSIPTVDAGEDQYMTAGGLVNLEASGAMTYEWSPADSVSSPYSSSTLASPADTMVFYVMGTDVNGCIGWDSVTVYVIPGFWIILPNAFSPNGDGLNDSYAPSVIGGTLESFHVYNRWGKEIFSGGPSDRWDGKYLGIDQEIDNYVIVATARDLLGRAKTESSVFLILR